MIRSLFAFVAFIVALIFVNNYYHKAKWFLSRNGYPFNFFSGDWKVFTGLKRLKRETTDEDIKRKASSYLKTLLLSSGAAIFFALFLIVFD